MKTERPSNNFDFVRLIAALMVIVSHQMALSGMKEPAVMGFHSLGGMGVVVFFSISGYLVAQSWNADPHFARFAMRRLLRIWPALCVVVLLIAFVIGPVFSAAPPGGYLRHPMTRDYLHTLWFDLRERPPTIFPGSARPFAMNGALWTIPLELSCYLLLAIAGMVGVLRSKWAVAVLLAACMYAYGVREVRGEQIAIHFSLIVEQYFFIEFALFFFTGVLLHYLPLHRSGVVRAVALGTVFGAGVVSIMFEHTALGLMLIVPLAVIMIGSSSTPYLRRAGRFGDLSYGLYIYGFPMQQIMISSFGDKLPWAVVFAMTLAATVACAWCSWHFVEKIALRFKPSRVPQRKLAVIDLDRLLGRIGLRYRQQRLPQALGERFAPSSRTPI